MEVAGPSGSATFSFWHHSGTASRGAGRPRAPLEVVKFQQRLPVNKPQITFASLKSPGFCYSRLVLPRGEMMTLSSRQRATSHIRHAVQ